MYKRIKKKNKTENINITINVNIKSTNLQVLNKYDREKIQNNYFISENFLITR